MFSRTNQMNDLVVLLFIYLSELAVKYILFTLYLIIYKISAFSPAAQPTMPMPVPERGGDEGTPLK